MTWLKRRPEDSVSCTRIAARRIQAAKIDTQGPEREKWVETWVACENSENEKMFRSTVHALDSSVRAQPPTVTVSSVCFEKLA
jgi:hypothetical protein